MPELTVTVRLKDLLTRPFRALRRSIGRESRAVERNLRGMNAAFGSLAKKIKLAVGAYLGWRGVLEAIRWTKAFANLEAARKSFEMIGRQIGATADAVHEWDKATRYAIGHAGLFAAANKAIVAGLVRSREEFTQLAEDATTFALALGKQVGPTLNEIISALITAFPRTFRQYGITNLEQQFRAAEESLGRVLTVQERQRIIMRALHEQAEKLRQSGLGTDETTLVRIEKIQRYMGDIAEDLGIIVKELVPPLLDMIRALEPLVLTVANRIAKIAKDLAFAWDVWKLERNLRRAEQEGAVRTEEFNRWLAGWFDKIFGPQIFQEYVEKYPRPREVAPETAWYYKRRGLKVPTLAELEQKWQANMKAYYRQRREQIYKQAKDLFDVLSQLWTTLKGKTAAWLQSRAKAGTQAEVPLDLGVMEITARPVREAPRWLSGVRQHMLQWRKFFDEFGEGFRIWAEEFGNFARMVKELAMDVYQSLTYTLGDLLFDALTGKMRSFKEYLRRFLQDILRMLTQFLAQRLVIFFFQQLIGGALYGAGYKGAAKFFGYTPSGGGAPAGGGTSTTSVATAQAGGVFRRPTLTLLGEAGPEAVVPLRGGRAIPVEVRKPSASVQVVFNVQTIDAASFDGWLVRRQGTIAKIIRNAMGTDGALRLAVRSA